MLKNLKMNGDAFILLNGDESIRLHGDGMNWLNSIRLRALESENG